MSYIDTHCRILNSCPRPQGSRLIINSHKSWPVALACPFCFLYAVFLNCVFFYYLRIGYAQDTVAV